MSRMSMDELAQALVDKHGLSKQDAETFVHEMVNTLKEGLDTDKQVKVKGWGTFKITTVSARESVDVNTGERIVIAERDKISFVPDTTLRNAVNKPFAQFDTVELGEDVEFDALDKQYGVNDEDNVHDADEDVEVVDAAQTLQPAFVAEPEVEQQPLPQPENTADLTASATEAEEHITETAVEHVEEREVNESVAKAGLEAAEALKELVESSVPDDVNAENIREKAPTVEELPHERVVDTLKDPEPEIQSDKVVEQEQARLAEQWNMARLQADNDNLQQVNDMLTKTLRMKNRLIMFFVFILVSLVGVCVYGGFEMFKLVQANNNRIGMLMNVHNNDTLEVNEVDEPVPAAKHTQVQRTEKKPQADTKLQNTESKVAEKAPTANNKPTTEPTSESKIARQTEQTTATADAQSHVANKYDADPRVRTGAYRIVGVDRSVTVKPGQTLSSISKLYLGPGMECYVEAVNGGLTSIKAGQTLRIPKLELKRKK